MQITAPANRTRWLRPLSTAYLLVLTPLALLGARAAESYSGTYFTLLAFLVFTTALADRLVRFVSLYLTVYLGVGLLNISSWRGYTSLDVLSMYAWGMYLLFMPLLLRRRPTELQTYRRVAAPGLIKLVVGIHLCIVYGTLMVVYATLGNVLFDQSLRFDIPTSAEYVIRSVLPITAVIPLIGYRRPGMMLILTAAPSILIGSRGSAALAFVAYAIVVVYLRPEVTFRQFLARNKTYLILAGGALALISIAFHLRRSGSSGLAPLDFIISYYFDFDNLGVRLIAPFYLGFKETIGLTNEIVTRGITNYLNPAPLFFADLLTVLPGMHLAGGQTLAQIIGTVEAGGLTPGLLGGLYIDYGPISIVAFLGFGALIGWIGLGTRRTHFYIIIYAQALVQFMHLFHRGFLKPEYLTSLLIAAFYFSLCYRWTIGTSVRAVPRR